MKKKLVLLLCLITCLFTFTACTSKGNPVDFEYDEKALMDQANQWLAKWSKVDYSQYTDKKLKKEQDSGKLDEETCNAYRRWRDNQKAFGAIKDTKKAEIKEDGDFVKVIMTLSFDSAKYDVEVTVPFDSDLQMQRNSIAFEEKLPLSKKMAFAALNTVLGMGTVFVVLILISLIISAFKFIPEIQEKMSKKQEAAMNVVESIDNTVSQIEEQEAEELVDDGELVAVITAAIMASMGAEAPADGLVVRSIKRAKTNKWQRA